jgi:hypothetical protein
MRRIISIDCEGAENRVEKVAWNVGLPIHPGGFPGAKKNLHASAGISQGATQETQSDSVEGADLPVV